MFIWFLAEFHSIQLWQIYGENWVEYINRKCCHNSINYRTSFNEFNSSTSTKILGIRLNLFNVSKLSFYCVMLFVVWPVNVSIYLMVLILGSLVSTNINFLEKAVIK